MRDRTGLDSRRAGEYTQTVLDFSALLSPVAAALELELEMLREHLHRKKSATNYPEW